MGCQGRKCRNAEMIDAQFTQNHFIKERNLDLEDRVINLQQQVAELTKQLNEYKKCQKDDMK